MNELKDILFTVDCSGQSSVLCYDGWQLISTTVGYSSKPVVCVHKSNFAASWTQALASCRSHGAHLLVLDSSFFSNVSTSSSTTDSIMQTISSYITTAPGSQITIQWRIQEKGGCTPTNLLKFVVGAQIDKNFIHQKPDK